MSHVSSLPFFARGGERPGPIADRTATRAAARQLQARVLAGGALGGLATLKLVMLAALFTQTDPYPPLRFAPLFGASLALSVFAGALLAAGSRWAVAPALLVALESLLSVGPQKLYPGESDFFAQTPAVYPAIVVGSACIATLTVACLRIWRGDAADQEEER